MMKKIIFALAFLGLVWGHEFPMMSNEELANLAGNVQADEIVDYHMELHKRMQEMDKPQAKEFRKKLREIREKNTEDMTLKEYRAKMEAIKQAIEEKIKTMDKEECKKSGLCHFYKNLEHFEKMGGSCKHKTKEQ